MMRYSNGLCRKLIAKRFEIGVSLLTCSHLDTDFVVGSILVGVEILDVQRNGKVFAELADKGFVALTLLSTQMEIAVHSMEGTRELHENVHEADGIGSTTDGNQHFVSFFQQGVLSDVLFYFFNGIHKRVRNEE